MNFLQIYFLFIYMSVLPECICVYQLCAWYSWTSEEDIESLELDLHMLVKYDVCTGHQT